ncbi:nucleotide exchange factor GrpE [Citricoccus parietis]|uniref:Protein GrpE n=1 Tax=Citricoccus parietis TaxID=592307 RepID=A0ABV6F744_9MICC
MPNHGNEEDREREEPVSFQDKRRIDPMTGKVREPAGQPAGAAEEQTNNDAGSGAADADGDALSQAEQILNSVADASDEGVIGAQDPELVSATAREEELRNDLLRVQAEFVNYKRRVDRDRDVSKDNAIQSVLTALLPVLDDLDAARAAGDLAEGPFASIATKFSSVLTGFGLERQDQDSLVGQPFDPTRHEAMLRQPSQEIPEEHVVQVFRNGYLRGERVLRAAQVMVSAGEG